MLVFKMMNFQHLRNTQCNILKFHDSAENVEKMTNNNYVQHDQIFGYILLLE